MEDFVTFEIAKKLKTKGFPQGNEEDITKLYYQISDNLQSAIMLSEGKDVKWQCPFIDEVLKWLRDEKDIFIEITVDVNDKFNYYFGIYKKGNDTWEYIGQNDTYDYFEMYEEAAMAGIEWVLNNLI